MAKMRVVQVSKAKGPFEIVEREIPPPGPGEAVAEVPSAASTIETASDQAD